MRDATAHALRAEEYEQRFLRSVEEPARERPSRRGAVALLDEPREADRHAPAPSRQDRDRHAPAPRWDEPRARAPRQRAYGNRAHSPAAQASGVPGRRTVTITGQAAAPRRRSPAAAGFAAKPDRAALWAFLLALFMIVMAIATAHAGA